MQVILYSSTHRLERHVGQTSVVRASTHIHGEFCLGPNSSIIETKQVQFGFVMDQ